MRHKKILNLGIELSHEQTNTLNNYGYDIDYHKPRNIAELSDIITKKINKEKSDIMLVPTDNNFYQFALTLIEDIPKIVDVSSAPEKKAIIERYKGITKDIVAVTINKSDLINEVISNTIGPNVSVGIVGTGRIGKDVSSRILSDLPLIKRLYLHNGNNQDKAKALGMVLNSVKTTPGIKINKSLEIKVANEIEEIKENCDYTLITIGKIEKEKKYSKRSDLLGTYAKDIIHIAERYKDYEGATIIVTTPIDMLSLLFYLHSNKTNITGFGALLDKARGITILNNWCEEIGIENPNIKLSVIGPHSNNLFINTGYVNNIPFNKIKFKDGKSFNALINELIEYGNEERELDERKPQSLHTGIRVMEYLKALINNKETHGSTLVDLNKVSFSHNYRKSHDELFLDKYKKNFPNGVFMGMPIRFREHKAQLSEINLETYQKRMLADNLQMERKEIMAFLDTSKNYEKLKKFFIEPCS